MTNNNGSVQVPESLREQLSVYRRQVWRLKVGEALFFCVTSITVAYTTVFVMDRLVDTPPVVRAAAFTVALAGCFAVPWFYHRWVWRRRTAEQLSQLIGHKLPGLGDQLLGVVELAHNPEEQARSRTLVEAALNQAAQSAAKRDFREATPANRLPLWAAASTLGVVVALSLWAFSPEAAQNAWSRFLRPWSAVDRYTFTALQPLPDEYIVPHGEPFGMQVALQEGSRWRPEKAEARIGRQRPVSASLQTDGYELSMPPQIGPDSMRIRVGDALRTVRIEPMIRPELAELSARVRLPDYLGRPEPVERDIRGGALSIVKGSRVALTAVANRDLASATVDDQPTQPQGARIDAPERLVEDSQQCEIAWIDDHDLSGVEPLRLSITALEDAEPSLVVENLPARKVVLESELIKFTVRARDDFGVQKVGFEWRGFPGVRPELTSGERLLAAGDHQQDAVEAQGVFSAKSLGIEPQPLEVRVFAEDYFPDRGRVYSAPHIFYVLTPDQHAIWMTEQLSKWHRQALEVRDRELQLYEANRELRSLSPEELDKEPTRKRIERQADAERVNGRRLGRLTAAGAELVREASRNPEIGVGHLEEWAKMLKVLEDISANRMPSVAELLDESSRAPKLASGTKQQTAPSAGVNRDSPPGKPSETDPDAEQPPGVPSIVDNESSQQPADASPEEEPGGKKKPSKGKLTLPVTTVAGSGKKQGECPAGDKMDQAITEQRDLLAEFEKIADEMNKVLANLEGSTLVKRLKAASRKQHQISGRAGEEVDNAFGLLSSRTPREPKELFRSLAAEQEQSGMQVSYIMDDLHAYFERRQMVRFKQVLDEMRELDILDGLRRVGDDLPKKQGLAIAQGEYWSDSLDRWADDLVDPACSGSCPGGASPESLPPSLVLEAMKILEAEVNLREETRVAEQARTAVTADEHEAEAHRLSEDQEALRVRVVKLGERILELEDAWRHFGKELNLLSAVEQVMGEARGILNGPNTGSEAIAAETEAIELLLRSKKINPNGGGGGGSSPGGGGGGDTQTPAIALVGRGVNEREVREDRKVDQTTGETGPSLPAEFRAGLDRYFTRLEAGGEGS